MNLRRYVLTVGLLMTLSLGAAGSASAAPAGYAISTKGLTAEAVFSTTSSAGPVVGGTYTDTYVFAADQVNSFNGEKFQEDLVFLQQVTYTYDEFGNFVYISNSNGFSAGDAVDFRGTKNLSTTTVTATVPMSNCDVLGCTDGGSVMLNAAFTGTGDTVRVNGVFHSHSGSFVLNARNNGARRDATGSATVDGEGVGGLLFGSLFSGSSSERYVSLERL